MTLTFAEDFSSSVVLDSELRGTPESGLYLNRGVLPILTANNLLSILPNEDLIFSAWDEATIYSKFSDSKVKSDVVSYESKVYQSISATNINNLPTDTDYWLETNIESLRIKSWLWTVEDNLLSQLSLHKKLIENQFIYDVGESLITLPNDYAAWVFEPKGSDYVKIKINQMALQANTTTPITVSVVNQGAVADTITLNPNNGLLEFEDVGYTISGKGRFFFVFPSQEVYSDNAFNDPLKYNGFVCYPAIGQGSTPQGATYTETSYGNGLNFNVSAYLDSSNYITNNILHFGKAYQAQAEMDFIQMLRFNSNVRTNLEQREIGVDKNYLDFQASDLSTNTVAKKYMTEIKEAKKSIERSFDRFLKSPKRLTVKRSSV